MQLTPTVDTDKLEGGGLHTGSDTNNACYSLKETVVSSNNEIAILERKLAVAVYFLTAVANMDCRKTCTILQRGNSEGCLNCIRVYAHGALTRIRKTT